MELGDLITPERIVLSVKAKTKKLVLQELAASAAEAAGLVQSRVLEALLQRESLGTTAIGRGIAIPHGRLPNLEKIVILFARLEEPVDFGAPDNEPCDLIFLLLSPEEAGADHLKALARISRLLRDPSTIAKLRASRDKGAIFAVLTEPLASHAA